MLFRSVRVRRFGKFLDIDPATLPQGVQLVNAPLYPISSTDIRHAIARSTCQGEWLHPKVWEEIQAKGYYK